MEQNRRGSNKIEQNRKEENIIEQDRIEINKKIRIVYNKIDWTRLKGDRIKDRNSRIAIKTEWNWTGQR